MGREPHPDRRACVGEGLDTEEASVARERRSCERETVARAIRFRRARLLAEVRDVAVRHPVPAVLEHPVLIATDGRMRTEEDMLAPRRSLDRVREQVEERLPSPSLLHRILRP